MIPLYILMALVKPGFFGVLTVVTLEQFAAGAGSSAHSVFLMRRCRQSFSASHYAFATAIVALGSTLSGVISGHINAAVGHPLYFTISFLASWPSLILVFLVPRTSVDGQD
jgi:PAT family beta-lactamase induction signal transducer AmpG